jgi:hypothetical protein
MYIPGTSSPSDSMPPPASERSAASGSSRPGAPCAGALRAAGSRRPLPPHARRAYGGNEPPPIAERRYFRAVRAPHRDRVALQRPGLGLLPTDGPKSWSGGTLFPRSSKKAARTINAASGNRPVVVPANLRVSTGHPSPCVDCNSSTEPRSAALRSTSTGLSRSAWSPLSRRRPCRVLECCQRWASTWWRSTGRTHR